MSEIDGTAREKLRDMYLLAHGWRPIGGTEWCHAIHGTKAAAAAEKDSLFDQTNAFVHWMENLGKVDAVGVVGFVVLSAALGAAKEMMADTSWIQKMSAFALGSPSAMDAIGKLTGLLRGWVREAVKEDA